jgi:hypothetical protein
MIVHRILLVLALAATAAALAADASAAPRKTRVVAATTAGAYRAVLTAVKTSSGPAPTAALSVATYVRSRGAWKRTGTRRIDGTFFWKSLSAPHAVCRFAIARKAAPVHVVVEPLVTAALGCGSVVNVDFRVLRT